MSDLATMTHDYQKAAATFPASRSTMISQSFQAQATNAFPEHESLDTWGGSTASGSNLTLFSFSLDGSLCHIQLQLADLSIVVAYQTDVHTVYFM